MQKSNHRTWKWAVVIAMLLGASAAYGQDTAEQPPSAEEKKAEAHRARAELERIIAEKERLDAELKGALERWAKSRKALGEADGERLLESEKIELEKAYAEQVEQFQKELQEGDVQDAARLGRQLEQEKAARLEAWAEDQAKRWEHWAKQHERHWEEWAAQHEAEWERWAKRYEAQWKEWAKGLERGEVSTDELREMYQRNLEMLGEMPVQELYHGIVENTAELEDAPWDDLAGSIDGLVRESIESAMKGLEATSVDIERDEAVTAEKLRAMQELIKNMHSDLDATRNELDDAVRPILEKALAQREALESGRASAKELRAVLLELLKAEKAAKANAQSIDLTEREKALREIENQSADAAKQAIAAEEFRAWALKQQEELARSAELKQKALKRQSEEIDELRNEIQKLREEIEQQREANKGE